MGLDRALAPPQGGVGTLPRYSVEQGRLGNGVESRLLRSEGLGVAMFQLFFPRGAAHMKAPAVGQMAVKSLLKGSLRLDEAELNDYFDHRGSLVSFTLLPDYVEARVVALAEHFVDSARCMLELLETPTFPPRALESVGGQLQQQYEFRELETAHNAQCALWARLFPPAPGDASGGYASSIHSADFAGISRDHILDFHRRAFATQGAMLFLSGDVSPRAEAAILSRVESLLLPSEPGYSQLELSMPELESKGATARADGGWGGIERIEMQDKLQSSIYVGCRLPILGAGITAANPLLRQAVALFGGYFTSRLMQNLRED